MTTPTAAARLSRLMALVPWLIQNDGVTIDVAAAHFGVRPEQLEKDLWLLIVCGLPGYGPDQLVDIQFWDDGIHVIDPQVLDRPLRLTVEEATALIVAVRLLAQVPGTHDRDALMTLTSKLEGAIDLPHDVPVVLDDADLQIVSVIQQALLHGYRLRIRYAGATADAVTERQVRPRVMLPDAVPPALLADCELAGSTRTFRVDRILSADILAPQSAAQAHQDPGLEGLEMAPEDPGEGLGAAAADATLAALASDERTPSGRAMLLLDTELRWAVDVYGMTPLSTRPDGRIEAELAYWDPVWVIRLILGLQGAAEVIGPADLRAAVADAARQALAGYAERATGPVDTRS